MANNIRVSAGNNNTANVTVSSTNINTPIKATSVEAVYHANRAEEYAKQAQQSATDAQNAERNASNVVNNISTLTQDALNDINNATTESLSAIDDASAPVFEHLDLVQYVSDNMNNVIYVASNVDTILNKTIDIGTVTTTEAGTNATVVDSGTQYNPVLDFTIPKGDKGETGENGKDGKDGKDGNDGGMDATYDEETQTLSFYNETGTALHPQWGGIEGDITHQSDLQATLNMKANKDELDNKQDKGNYALKSEIPNISNLATKSEVTQGLNTKQDKGDYALKEEIPDITPLATKQELTQGLNTKQPKGNYALVDDIPTQVSELTNDSNFATQTQVMQAIASIPQFSLVIVDTLPETGAKMTLYLVPKDGEAPDIYNEYIWIEQTSSYEHLGSTAVDLTDYVKNTDYATTDKAGVIKTTTSYGLAVSSTTGTLYGATKSLALYNTANDVCIVCKGTLENVKNDLVKRAVTANDIELTDEEKTSARTWLGAVGKTDYAGNDKAGIVKASTVYGLNVGSTGNLFCSEITLNSYSKQPTNFFIAKGTLDNVLTQYATNETVGEIDDILDQINGGTSLLATKTVVTTEADYEALETKDANTLYLIEE